MKILMSSVRHGLSVVIIVALAAQTMTGCTCKRTNQHLCDFESRLNQVIKWDVFQKWVDASINEVGLTNNISSDTCPQFLSKVMDTGYYPFPISIEANDSGNCQMNLLWRTRYGFAGMLVAPEHRPLHVSDIQYNVLAYRYLVSNIVIYIVR